MNDDTKARIQATLLQQLHDSTHVGPTKLSHPNCPHCQQEYNETRLGLDGMVRQTLGLTGAASTEGTNG